MYDDDDDDYNYDIDTKWYSLVSECCIIKKEQDSISLAYISILKLVQLGKKFNY